YLRVHTPALNEEDAAFRRNRLLSCQQVLQHRSAGALRMLGLGHLRELLRIAKQDQVPSGEAYRNGVGEGELPRLVDQNQVKRFAVLGAREEPRRSRHQLEISAYVAIFFGRLDHFMGALVATPLADT